MSRSTYRRRKNLIYRIPGELPDLPLVSQAAIIIIDNMYKDQLDNWNKQLETLSATNAQYHGRSEKYAVYYNGKRYSKLTTWEYEQQDPEFCLPLHPEHPELEDQMRVIADQMDTLKNERNLVSRFIAGILHLNVTKEQFVRILGDNLLEGIPKTITDAIFRNGSSEPLQQESIKRYAEENQDIVDMIGERRLINLVLR